MNNQKVAGILKSARASFDGEGGPKHPDLIDHSFPKQAEFLEDTALLRAALCTRRAGKSYGAASLMFKRALEVEGSSILYIALTRDSAKKIMWKDCIKVLNKKYELGCKFNEVELTATLPTGTIIYLTGVDAKPSEMEKLLGQKYALVIIDEAASFRINLDDLVYKTLLPAVSDYDGQILMIGTPGLITKGLFFDITTGKEPGWKVFKWSWEDNPYQRKHIQKQLEILKTTKPGFELTPAYKQMYTGQWYIDEDKLVYKFAEVRNTAPSLPKAREYFYILGVDLGYDPDPSAFVLAAYSAHDPNLYFIHAEKKTKMDVTSVANRIKHFQKIYPNVKVVIDAGGQGKQIVAEITRRHGIALTPAEKQDKAGFIELMNADFIMGRIKVLPECLEALSTEWAQLIWDEQSAKRTELAACDNHLSDGGLYAWRWAYNFAWTIAPKPKNPHKEEAVDEFWEKEAAGVKDEKPFWEDY